MRRNNPLWIRVLLVAWFLWLADIGSKTWALATLEGREPQKILGNYLELTLAKNSGAAFSLATGRAFLLATFAILVIATIGFWASRLTSRPWSLVLGLVLGGTLGNLTDRIFRAGPKRGMFQGQVIDWISIPHWPIFNLADSAIVIAAVMATVLAIRNIAPISTKKSGKNSEGEDPDGS